MAKTVQMAFESQGLILAIADILPLKQIKATIRCTEKYQQVLASVREVGIIEPLIVFPQKDNTFSNE